MNCLLLDTATEACSVALQWQGQQWSQFEICPQQHSQRLLPMVDELLTQAGVSLQQLDFLGFGQGPGSFTGVRIATGMLQGLALGSQLPAVGVSTLAAMAQRAICDYQVQDVFCAIDARMGEVYFAHYQNMQGRASLVGSEQVLSPEHASALLVEGKNAFGVGTAWAAYPQLLAESSVKVADDILYPDAKDMIVLATEYFSQGKWTQAAEVTPVYLRDTVTWKKLPGRE